MKLSFFPLFLSHIHSLFGRVIICLPLLLLFGQLYGQSEKIVMPTLPTYNPAPPISVDTKTLGSVSQPNSNAAQKADDEIRKHQERQNKLAEQFNDVEVAKKKASIPKVNHSFPKNRSYGERHFRNAFREISSMIDGGAPLNLKRAVYLTEHAYDTTLSYANFERQISKLVNVIQLELKQSKVSPSDNIGKIMTVFKLMADTLHVKNPITERAIATYPMGYDFDDFYGMGDYHKMFVSKLMATGRGQCHSLPLLFLILCQEINAKAYLSFAPEHSYIKFKDKNGSLQNIELTNQVFTTDQFIMQSGYISSAAIKSRIYMDTLGLKRIINCTLNDLTNSYVKKYGYGEFVFECASKALMTDHSSIHAYMNMANYFNMLGRSVEQQYQVFNVPQGYYFQSDNEFRRIVSSAVYYGKRIDELGYAEMPPDLYMNWLKSLKNESMKQQHLERKRVLNTMIEH